MPSPAIGPRQETNSSRTVRASTVIAASAMYERGRPASAKGQVPAHHPYAQLEGVVVAPELGILGDVLGNIRLTKLEILDHFVVNELVTVVEPQQSSLSGKQFVGLHLRIFRNRDLSKSIALDAVYQRIAALHIFREAWRAVNDLRNQVERSGSVAVSLAR